MKSKSAQELGRKGGQARSEAKTAAARENAKKPRKKWVTAIAYEVAGVEQYKAFGSVLVRGKPPAGADANMRWMEKAVIENGVGLSKETALEFLELACTSMAV